MVAAFQAELEDQAEDIKRLAESRARTSVRPPTRSFGKFFSKEAMNALRAEARQAVEEEKGLKGTVKSTCRQALEAAIAGIIGGLVIGTIIGYVTGWPTCWR